MKDLAFKESQYDSMYPTAKENKKPPKRYPRVTLPLHLLGDKNIDLDDEITFVVKGKVNRVEKSKDYEEFSVELKKGELKDNEGTLLG